MTDSNGPLIAIITASVSATSRSEKLGSYVGELFAAAGRRVEYLKLRSLPAAPLLAADASDPDIAAAIELLGRADGVVIVTPTYKGTFSGLLKVFLDLLPQYALRGKNVLPLATGGTIAHVLMLDYGLRPVLQTMWPRHIAQGCFVLDKNMLVGDDDRLTIDEAGGLLLKEVLDAYDAMLDARPIPVQSG